MLFYNVVTCCNAVKFLHVSKIPKNIHNIYIYIFNYFNAILNVLHTLISLYIILNFSAFSGQYACTTTVNEMPYVIWQIITIQPYPNIEVSTSKVVQCEDTTIPLQCCVQEMYQVEWNISCTSTSTGNTHSFYM